MVGWLIWRFENFLARSSLVGDRPVYAPTEFPWTKSIEAGFPAIRRELDELMRHRDALPNIQDLSPEQKGLTSDDGWKIYALYTYGLKARRNCRRCLETTRLLEQIPGMKTAFFSVLAPGKRLAPHRGPYKGVLRYHLGLIVPEPRQSCGIRVGGELMHWSEGESLVFDDHFEHEAWNETEHDRVVLFVDFVRPMSFPGCLVNWLLIKVIAISPMVLGLAGNYLEWERQFEKVMNAPRT